MNLPQTITPFTPPINIPKYLPKYLPKYCTFPIPPQKPQSMTSKSSSHIIIKLKLASQIRISSLVNSDLRRAGLFSCDQTRRVGGWLGGWIWGRVGFRDGSWVGFGVCILLLFFLWFVWDHNYVYGVGWRVLSILLLWTRYIVCFVL